MPKEKQREAWTKVIEVFKELEYLYDKKNKHYFNRDMRHEGYKMLLQVYNEEVGEDDITLDNFKKKLENMRTSHGRELKKVNASKRSRWGSTDVYVPTLWYFSLFDFLEGMNETSRTGNDTLDENFGSPESEESSSDNEQVTDKEVATKTPPSKKQKKTFQIKQEKTPDSAQTQMTQKEDDWEIIGKSIGIQMRNLNKHQQVIAQKIISDAIFYGNLGQLTDESVITLSPQHVGTCPRCPERNHLYPSATWMNVPSPQQSP